MCPFTGELILQLNKDLHVTLLLDRYPQLVQRCLGAIQIVNFQEFTVKVTCI